jgi:hypothetical protein
MSVIAFHEKAGRSQVEPWFFHKHVFLFRRVASVAMLPSALSERFVSLGAHWAFSFQPVLLSVWRPVVLLLRIGTWARRLTQSPELGFGSCLSSCWSDFDFVVFAFLAYAAVAIVTRMLLCNGS